MPPPETLRLATLSGSLRRASYNSALIRALPELAPPAMHFVSASMTGIPVYDGDLEDRGVPDAVTDLHRAIRACDGLIIATPEYNHGIPGGLKNTIDWLSRGAMPHGLYGIPTAILGASDGMIGTTRAQYALRQTLAALNAPTMPFPQVLVSHAERKIDGAGVLHDEATREFMRAWLLEVERWMRRFPRGEREGT
jgi:chromate reductase